MSMHDGDADLRPKPPDTVHPDADTTETAGNVLPDIDCASRR
jgi:hypothetical protein